MRNPDLPPLLIPVVDDDPFWQERADEYLRLSEESRDSNPPRSAAFAALARAYLAAVKHLEAGKPMESHLSEAAE